jgi:hypothetical protein
VPDQSLTDVLAVLLMSSSVSTVVFKRVVELISLVVH